jgi:hypothetical protein
MITRKTGYSQFTTIKFFNPNNEIKLFTLLRKYIPISSSSGFINDFLHVGKNAKVSIAHTSMTAQRSFLTDTQKSIKIRQEMRDIVSSRVIFFSPYLSERIKITPQTKALAASAPNHQISSPLRI